MLAVAGMASGMVMRSATAQVGESGAPKDQINNKSATDKKKEQEKKKSKSKSDDVDEDVSRAPVFASAPAGITMETITATIETDPVPTGGDAADDPAIWVHPSDPAQSTIIAHASSLG